MKKSSRRKTSSPRKVIKSIDHIVVELPSPVALSELPLDASEDASTAASSTEAIPSDPVELANHINQNPIAKFFETPEVPAVYQTELLNVKSNTKPGEEAVYRCLACGKKTYKSAPGLKRHLMRTCPAVVNVSYLCTLCKQGFEEQSMVMNHIRDVHVEPYTGTGNSCTERRAARLSRRKVRNYEERAYVTESSDLMNYHDENAQDLAVVPLETMDPRYSVKTKSTYEKSQSSSGSLNTYAWLHCPLAEAFKWTYMRRKELEQRFPVVHQNLPHCTYEDGACHLSAAAEKFHLSQTSPSFAIDGVSLNRVSKNSRISKSNRMDYSKLDFQTLKLFEALPVESGEPRTFFTGAPVWALDWCPVPLSEKHSDQILAVANHSREHLVDPTQSYFESSLIQFWNCGRLPAVSEDTAERIPTLAFGVTIDVGPVWDMQWCPLGGRGLSDDRSPSRLGVLALACASGDVYVLSIPKPQATMEHCDPIGSGCDKKKSSSINGKIKRVPPSVILKPLSGDKRPLGQCMSVSWSLDDGCSFIAGGYASGHVALWEVNTKSPFLRSEDRQGVPVVYAFHTFRGHSKPVNAISWCPFDSYIFASAGADRLVKLWDRRKTNSDLRDNLAPKSSIVYEMTWPLLYNGLFAATDSSFSIPHSHGCLYLTIPASTPMNNIFPTKAACSTVSCSDWLNSAVGGDFAGNALVFTCNNWNRATVSLKKVPRMLLFQSLALWDEDADNDHANMNDDAINSSDADGALKYKLVFHDSNMTSKLGDWEHRTAHKRVRTNEDFADEVYRHPPVSAVHKMRWNANLCSYTWVASGTHSGLVRLHCVSGLVTHDVDTASRECTSVHSF